jgi:predicted  nucleic acid-binding Zn-ribbon protein
LLEGTIGEVARPANMLTGGDFMQTFKRIIVATYAASFTALTLPCLAMAAEPQAGGVSKTEPAVELDDKKVTDTEAKLDQIQVKDANKFAKEQAEVLNTVPGIEVSTSDLNEKPAKKKGFSLNPIRWIFAPVIKLQEQTVRLQQQMMKLTGPIAALQPAMLNLQNRVDKMGGQLKAVQHDMRDVRSEMGGISNRLDETVGHMKGVEGRLGETVGHMKGVENRIATVSGQMNSVQASIKGTYTELKRMRPDISRVRSDIDRIREPIMALKEPLISMAVPIHNLDTQVSGVHDDISSIRKPLTNMEQPITNLEKQLSRLSGDIAALRDLLSMVLTSIFVAAGLVAIGTPIAAILIWRHKNKFLPPPKPGESSEDELTTGGQRTAISGRR